MSNLRPVILGYDTQVKPTGDAHVCPNCKQTSVFSSTSTKEVVVLFLPVSSKSTAQWVCTTEKCGWMTPIENEPTSWEPTPEYEVPKLVDV